MATKTYSPQEIAANHPGKSVSLVWWDGSPLAHYGQIETWAKARGEAGEAEAVWRRHRPTHGNSATYSSGSGSDRLVAIVS